MKKISYFVLIFLILASLVILAKAQEADIIAPNAVTDLAVSTTTVSTISLTWTAPGDDNKTGTSTSYTLRYATSTITESNWALAYNVTNEPTPKVASSTETMVITGLASSTKYYFGLKAKDEANNESGLSNIASGTTLAPPAVCGNGVVNASEECDDGNLTNGDGCSSLCKKETTPQTSGTCTVSVMPKALNTKSKGKWVNVQLYLPAPNKVSQVDLSSVKLNGSLSPDGNFKGINLFSWSNKDKEKGHSLLTLKFSRQGLIDLIGSATGKFAVTISGKVNNNNFSCSDSVYVLKNITIKVDDDDDDTDEDNDNSIQATSTIIIIQVPGKPEVYQIKNKFRRHIPNLKAFNRLGLKWENIKKVSQEELDSYLDDTLLRANNSSAVYLVVNGIKRHIPNPEVFNSYGLDWNDISVVSPSDLDDYPNATLVRTAGDTKVFLLANGKRHWIPTLAVFNSRGFSWDDVVIINSTETNVLPEDSNLQ